MAITPKILDPVQGLVDYVLHIKPYHTKIIEVLETYIHTDYLYVNMTDKIEFCVNFGIPNLNTLFSFNIVNIDQTLNMVTVNGQATGDIHVGQRIQIEFSTANDYQYLVTDIIFDPNTNTSEITLDNFIFSDIADGKIVNSVITYCPNGSLKSTNVLELDKIQCKGGYGDIFDEFISTVIQINTLDIGTENSIVLSGNHLTTLESTTTISLIDDSLTPNDTIGTFHIDSFNYNGVDTVINVIEHIHLMPLYTPNVSYKASITKLGYDEIISCDFKDNNSETLFISMVEDFQIDIGIDWMDSFKVYNMENNYQSSFDNLTLGIIDSITEPMLPESNIPPMNPNMFDIWFDTSTQTIKQWVNYQWLSKSHVYWYQEDITNNQIVTYYKRVKSFELDTGWVEIDPKLNDELSEGFDLEAYSVDRNNYFHDPEHVLIDQTLNGIFMSGGDFRPLLYTNNTIKSYGTSGYISNIKYSDFEIITLSNNIISLHGNMTNLFRTGLGLTIDYSDLTRSEFNVISSSFDGTYTHITLDSNPKEIGHIPGIFYVQPDTFSLNSTSTLYILDTTLDLSIKSLGYFYNGPLQISTHLFPNDDLGLQITEEGFTNDLFITVNNAGTGDIAQTTITDDVVWAWGNIIDWFQYYVIGIQDLNTLTIAGNSSLDLQVNQSFRIIGFNDNVGVYSISSSVFNGINTIITLNEALVSTDYSSMYIEPVDILPIQLIFQDLIGVTITEDTNGALLETSGNIIQSTDYTYFDIGGFDSQI